MAKVTEGDDRWIVNDLGEQGKNVNNWHWSEKNVFPAFKTRLTSLFEMYPIYQDKKFRIVIKKVESLKGEVIITNRKGKVRPFYELEAELKWKGEILDDQGKSIHAARGKILIPEISQDQQSVEEINLKIELKKKCTSKEAIEIKDALFHHGKKAIRSQIEVILSELKSGSYSSEKKNSSTLSNVSIENEKKDEILIIKEKFNADSRVIFESFVDERRISAYTQSSAFVEAKVGGKFKIMGGRVSGEFLNLKPFQEIAQKWRLSTWKEEEYSNVLITIEEDEDGKTLLTLTQSNFPKDVVPRSVEGLWREQIINRIGVMFGGLLKF